MASSLLILSQVHGGRALFEKLTQHKYHVIKIYKKYHKQPVKSYCITWWLLMCTWHMVNWLEIDIFSFKTTASSFCSCSKCCFTTWEQQTSRQSWPEKKKIKQPFLEASCNLYNSQGQPRALKRCQTMLQCVEHILGNRSRLLCVVQVISGRTVLFKLPVALCLCS